MCIRDRYSTVDAQNELIKTGEQLKDNYFKQEAAQKAVISETVNLGKSIKDTDDAIKKINSTLDAGAKVLAEQKIELEKNKKEQKELKKELDAGRITLDQYSEKMVFLIQNEQELKVQTSQLTKAQTQFAKENISVAGSMDQAGIRIGRLREEDVYKRQGLKNTIGSNKYSLIAYYVYFYITRNTATITTGIGEVLNKTDNANRVSPINKQVDAWNKMVRWIYELYDFLEEKKSTYPEWQKAYCFEENYRLINSMNL